MTDTIPTDQELVDGTGDHDCRTRVERGHANRLDISFGTVHHIQIKYECDLCGRDVFLICAPFNVQMEQYDDTYDGTVLEPSPEADSDEIYDHDDLHPA